MRHLHLPIPIFKLTRKRLGNDAHDASRPRLGFGSVHTGTHAAHAAYATLAADAAHSAAAAHAADDAHAAHAADIADAIDAAALAVVEGRCGEPVTRSRSHIST